MTFVWFEQASGGQKQVSLTNELHGFELTKLQKKNIILTFS